jgi:hypothetical protein
VSHEPDEASEKFNSRATFHRPSSKLVEQALVRRLSIKRLQQTADKTAAKVCDGTIRVKGTNQVNSLRAISSVRLKSRRSLAVESAARVA